MNLKDSKKKKEVKVSEFEKFCANKGLTRERSTWESDCDKQIEMKEADLKEMVERKRLAKFKKKK